MTTTDAQPINGTQRILGLDQSLVEVQDELSYRLWSLEVGLFDNDTDPTTPFDTVELVVAGESPDACTDQAFDLVRKHTHQGDGCHLAMINGASQYDVTEVPDIDLFEYMHLLPVNVQEVLQAAADQYSDDQWDYTDCQAMEKSLRLLGYAMDYGLCATPQNLRRI